MSGGFGLPVLNLQGAIGGIGGAYNEAYDRAQSRAALGALGTRLRAGDFDGAAGLAFDAGDPQTGLGLLKLGEAARSRRLGEEASREFSSALGGAFGLGGASGAAPGGVSGRSSGLPSFSDTGGEAGGYVASLFKRESNNDTMAQAPTSSARGLGQFTRDTWNGLARKRPDLGLTPVDAGRDGRIDPDQMLRATQALTADNEGLLRGSGLPVNDATRYSLHFLGAGGGRRFVAGAMSNPDAPAASYANPDQVRANRTVFYRRDGTPKTAGEVMGDFARSFGGSGGGQPTRQASAPAPRPVAYADDEAGVQALEQRMGMVPAAPRQVASLDPRADLPAEGAEEAAFTIPPGPEPLARRGSPVPSLTGASDRTIPGGLPGPQFGSSPPGRTMTLPGEDGGAPAPVQMAENARIGAVPASAVAASPLSQRIPLLLRAAAHPNLPDEQRQLATTLLKDALGEARMPDGVKEFVWARANGLTQARNPSEYAAETAAAKRGPTVVGAGSSVFQDGRFITAPGGREDRDEGAKITAGIEARRAAAPGLGLEEGTPAWRSYVATGKVGADRDMSATEKRAIEAADTVALSAQQSIGYLEQAKALSAKAYAGPLAAYRGQATGVFGSEAGQATIELDNLVATNALASLKAIFGAAPTEGERKILLDIQGSSSLPHALRIKIYDRAIQAAELRQGQNQAKADAIREGRYYRQGGGEAVRGAPAGDAGPDARIRPAPANRDGGGQPSLGDLEAEARRRGLIQ